MTIARVRSVWSGPAIVGGGVTDLYFFGSVGSEDDMCGAVRTFWNALAAGIHTGNSVLVEPEVVNLNEGSGDVVSIATVSPAPLVVNGSASGDPLPPANQVLVRWLTDGVVANRRVRGRTNVPSFDEGANSGGLVAAATQTFVNTAANALIANPDTQLVVWSRPTPARAGTQHSVLSASCWSQWAVLRSRRD